MSQLRIGTAQFPVSADIARNLKYMTELTTKASRAGADIVHFSEACLGGYGGQEFKTWDGYDWGRLMAAEEEVTRLAKKRNIGIVYGTNRRVSNTDIRNSLIYVSRDGKRAAHYDKLFCTRNDLKYYKSGKQFATFEINGFRCGMLICYDVRFPELFREYKKRNAQVLFHSFYNARADGPNIKTVIMRPTLQAGAASNYFYISGNNSSGYYQTWPSVFIVPDGTIVDSCRRHRTDLLINTIDSEQKFYDASAPFRDLALKGILHSE